MAPKGLKKLLKETAPCKLTGSGENKRFQTVDAVGTGIGTGKAPAGRRTVLKGVTKRLQSTVFSEGFMPHAARASDAPAGGHWRGPGGGRRRGAAVDAQCSRLAGLTPEKRYHSRMLALTRNVFATLAARNLEPVAGQRGVCSVRHRIGTAADMICYDCQCHHLVIVELKCGHNGSRTAAAQIDGGAQKMRVPLHKALDNTINRHLAQLAVTHHLFVREKLTLQKLGNLGVGGVSGLLMYANDSGVDCYPLQEWWIKKAPKILEAMRA